MVTLMAHVIGLGLLVIGQSNAIYMDATLTNADFQRIFMFDRQPECSLKRLTGYNNSLKQLLYLSAKWKEISNGSPFSSRMRGFTRVRKTNRRQSSTRLMKRIPLIGTGTRDYACDTTRLTIQTIIEYVHRGTICGFQVGGIRFGLGK
ncbi:hypothetical protein KP79_PYT03656 [Mizuhopecten yessoensis]|uniref:Uncharacterized protein n=1 Tax=Mizuhopecten yessoensis TaxID=6573 RepID=A0A210R5C3_MIZYE|nr:hypothetical protein KP79_PYT03656 [Mizuhopecten yessoensis]